MTLRTALIMAHVSGNPPETEGNILNIKIMLKNWKAVKDPPSSSVINSLQIWVFQFSDSGFWHYCSSWMTIMPRALLPCCGPFILIAERTYSIVAFLDSSVFNEVIFFV